MVKRVEFLSTPASHGLHHTQTPHALTMAAVKWLTASPHLLDANAAFPFALKSAACHARCDGGDVDVDVCDVGVEEIGETLFRRTYANGWSEREVKVTVMVKTTSITTSKKNERKQEQEQQRSAVGHFDGRK